MIQVNLVWILLLIAFIAVFAALIVTKLLLDKGERELKISFLRHFPYEVLSIHKDKSKIYKVLLFIFAGLTFSPIFVIVPLVGDFGDLAWIAILASCFYGFSGLLTVGIHIFEAKFIKTHALLASILVALVFLSTSLSALFSILTFNVYNRFGEGSPLAIGCFALLIVAALFDLFIAFNPKLKDWTKLEKLINSDGSISYDRPKIFPLALSEWLIIFSLFISEVVFYIALIH